MAQIAITVNLIVKADTVERAVQITEARLTRLLNQWYVEDHEIGVRQYLEGSLLLWNISPVGERHEKTDRGTTDQRIPPETKV